MPAVRISLEACKRMAAIFAQYHCDTLKNLKLRRILEIYEEQLRAADKDDISYTDFITRLVRAQWEAKQETSGVAHPARQPAREMDAGDLSIRSHQPSATG